MKKTLIIQTISLGCLFLFISQGLFTVGILGVCLVDEQSELSTLSFVEGFSSLDLSVVDGRTRLDFAEANAYSIVDDELQVPYISRVFEFPVGTTVIDISVEPTSIENIFLDYPVSLIPVWHRLDGESLSDADQLKGSLVTHKDRWKTKWFSYSTGMGLNEENEPVLFLSLHLMPCQIDESAHLIEFARGFDVKVTYDGSDPQPTVLDAYDLLIIAPDVFSQMVEPLISHKNDFGMKTMFTPVEEIYVLDIGRDKPEQIKYYIKDALDCYGVKYVLLIGDVKLVPIRHTYAGRWEADVLSDLYYGDIYNATHEFCSWDKNQNNRFGEIADGYDIDGVDLYTDVHVGRLPCSTVDEVDVVVNKIIDYERYTYNQIWFQKIVLAGGDTFPLSRGSLPFVFEGEITNQKVAQQLPEFAKKRLWASLRNLNAFTFNRAINKGAGFVTYAGHGFEHGWGTYRPNALQFRMGFTHPLYYTPFIKRLRNQNRLPIIFFDACLTAKLDFNVTDLEDYYPRAVRLLTRLNRLSDDPMNFYPSFAWAFVRHEGGGAIATIGATRTAYTMVNRWGVNGGAGYLDVHFFKAYKEGVSAGEMLTSAQNAYINNVGRDYFTIEEFMLVGDPSLRVGGYPSPL